MEFFLLGLSHKKTPIEVRERLAFKESQEQMTRALTQLLEAPAIEEGMIISTCNRVEIYGVGRSSKEGIASLRSFLVGYQEVLASEIDSYLYTHVGEGAMNHLFRVTSSLESMVVGEPQITGQVKKAFNNAKQAKTTGPTLHKIMEKAFSVAKRVRTETAISENAVSISYAAVELARKIFGDLHDRRALLVGAGKMGSLAARHLRGRGVSEILVSNRTHEKAIEVAKEMDAMPVPMEQLDHYLELSDIILFATSASRFLLSEPEAKKIAQARKYRPMFVIDLGVPRVVESSVNDVENVYLYDIDDLRSVVDENLEERASEAQRGSEIVRQELELFLGSMAQLEVAPLISKFNEKVLEICQGEMDKTLSEMGTVSSEDRNALERMVKSVVRRIAHNPIQFLKNASKSGNGQLIADTFDRLFGLEGAEDSGGNGASEEDPEDVPASSPDKSKALSGGDGNRA